tara:strand:+ start:612 stop:803 length:192 start_codon:yes stop_codon:yes gene_type:complete
MALPKYKLEDKKTYVTSCKHYSSDGFYQLNDGNLVKESISTYDLEQVDNNNFYIINCPFCTNE